MSPGPRNRTRWSIAINAMALVVLAVAVAVIGVSASGMWRDALQVSDQPAPTTFSAGYYSLRPGELAALHELGFDETTYAVFVALRQVALFSAAAFIAGAVWRRSLSWVARFVALFLVSGNILVLGDGATFDAGGLFEVLVVVLAGMGMLSLIGLMYVYPDGAHVRLFAGLVLVLAAVEGAGALLVGGQFFWESFPWLMIGMAGGGVVTQVRRIRSKPGDPGTSYALLIVYTLAFPLLFLTDLLPHRLDADLTDLMWRLTVESLVLGIPLSVGLVIVWRVTQHDLWDMESVINRTAVYGVLSAVVATVYILAVTLTQAMVRRVAGIDGGNTFGVVAATALVAVVVLPVQRHVQAGIDRLFFRRRYDMNRTLASFSHQVRTRENLGDVANELVHVVEHTFQPSGSVLLLPQQQVRSP